MILPTRTALDAAVFCHQRVLGSLDHMRTLIPAALVYKSDWHGWPALIWRRRGHRGLMKTGGGGGLRAFIMAMTRDFHWHIYGGYRSPLTCL